jgi:hypothetical protein
MQENLLFWEPRNPCAMQICPQNSGGHSSNKNYMINASILYNLRLKRYAIGRLNPFTANKHKLIQITFHELSIISLISKGINSPSIREPNVNNTRDEKNHNPGVNGFKTWR